MSGTACPDFYMRSAFASLGRNDKRGMFCRKDKRKKAIINNSPRGARGKFQRIIMKQTTIATEAKSMESNLSSTPP